MSSIEYFEQGQFVRDRKKESVCVVVAIHETPANEFAIPALAGKSVASCNPDKWSDDPVVQIVYVESANYRLAEWTPRGLVEAFEKDQFNSVPGLRAYSMPAGRLEVIPQQESVEDAVLTPG